MGNGWLYTIDKSVPYILFNRSKFKITIKHIFLHHLWKWIILISVAENNFKNQLVVKLI